MKKGEQLERNTLTINRTIKKKLFDAISARGICDGMVGGPNGTETILPTWTEVAGDCWTLSYWLHQKLFFSEYSLIKFIF